MKVTMYNPKSGVTVITNDKFQTKWERLGFIVAKNVILFKLAG